MLVSFAEAKAALPHVKDHFSPAGVTYIGVRPMGSSYGLVVFLQRAVPAGVELPANLFGVPLHVVVTGSLEAK